MSKSPKQHGPAVMRIGPYRFFLYSNESGERQHIHVCAGGEEAKFWLEPLEMAWNWGFSERQLSQIERHIRDNLAFLMEAWDEFFWSVRTWPTRMSNHGKQIAR